MYEKEETMRLMERKKQKGGSSLSEGIPKEHPHLKYKVMAFSRLYSRPFSAPHSH